MTDTNMSVPVESRPLTAMVSTLDYPDRLIFVNIGNIRDRNDTTLTYGILKGVGLVF